MIERAIATLDLLEHRGAAGADADTGDGAGILIQLPHEFFKARASEFGVEPEDVPGPGELAIAVCFLPADPERRLELGHRIEEMVRAEGQIPLGSREVPVDPSQCGRVAHEAMPTIRQLMIRRGPDTPDADSFERKLYVIRRTLELETSEATFPSFSARTIVYKGMLTAPQLSRFYPDLRDPLMKSALAIVHSRFSTNTFPSWSLAHPHRMSAHNGEINTLQGNINWMQAREAILRSELFGADLHRCLPLVAPGTSDSLAFDHVFELLCLAGHSLPHAAMMMIPRAHENRDGVPPEIEGFYNYHSRLIEPWDGPAAITFTDGKFLGATLDRNGLRPGRWLITHDGWVAVSSEAGSFQVPDENVAYRGRLRPGSMFVVDLEQGRVLDEGEAESVVANSSPWGAWDAARSVRLDELPQANRAAPPRSLLRGAEAPPARVRLLARGPPRPPHADGARRQGADRLDGERPGARHVLRAGADPLQLLQAALRAGDEPGDRLGPRAHRDEPSHRPRPRVEPARARLHARDAAAPRPARRPERRDGDPARDGLGRPRRRASST